jgi:hypothetical protein
VLLLIIAEFFPLFPVNNFLAQFTSIDANTSNQFHGIKVNWRLEADDH